MIERGPGTLGSQSQCRPFGENTSGHFLFRRKKSDDRHFSLLQESDGEERALKRFGDTCSGIRRPPAERFFSDRLGRPTKRGILFDAVASYLNSSRGREAAHRPSKQ